jgi:hypothetical protein
MGVFTKRHRHCCIISIPDLYALTTLSLTLSRRERVREREIRISDANIIADKCTPSIIEKQCK